MLFLILKLTVLSSCPPQAIFLWLHTLQTQFSWGNRSFRVPILQFFPPAAAKIHLESSFFCLQLSLHFYSCNCRGSQNHKCRILEYNCRKKRYAQNGRFPFREWIHGKFSACGVQTNGNASTRLILSLLLKKSPPVRAAKIFGTLFVRYVQNRSK